MTGLPGSEDPEPEHVPKRIGVEGDMFEGPAWEDPDPNHVPEAMVGLQIEEARRKLRSAARGDPDEWRHPDLIDEWPITGDDPEAVDDIDMQEAAEEFMLKMGMTPTPDAVGQLLEVFVPCLRIMCERGYDPTGALWRKAGILHMIGDVRKKFERLWYRTWTLGIRHDDSGFDLINFTGFVLRADPDSRFGDSGEPAGAPDA
jgi:hypothetical protein